MPKISVLMPVYNTKEEYLREAIESILNQTFRDFEFIIVNDGSTNNAEEVIKSYDDERIKYFYKQNSGIADTLNFGLSKACSEYIARMDSDDISLPERFEKEVEYLEKHHEISILGTNFKIIPKGEEIHHPEFPKYLDFIKGCLIAHPTIMFRRSDIERFNLQYNGAYKCEDYELWSRAIRNLKFANIQEILLHYRWHDSNLSTPSEAFNASTEKVRQNMLDFLTDDKDLQRKIKSSVFPEYENTTQYTFWERIFSIKNRKKNQKKYKVLCVLGCKIAFRKYVNTKIVKLMGGLGNQMFQYAFGKALEARTGQKVLFDKSWFNISAENFTNGVAKRNYELGLFKNNISFCDEQKLLNCKKKIQEKNAFIYDEILFKNYPSVCYEGYFQNEQYFKDISAEIKKEFSFPEIAKDDAFNQAWFTKINACKNPVFIHLRRGDYVNLGWNLTTEYYRKAIEYIKEHVNNPTFFVFGQDCEDYIKDEFDMNVPFEIVGEDNSKNKEDWKDIVLMMACKHAIIANSTFSWWAAWLGKANEQGIVVAPTPFVNEQDEIICDNWVKIERD